MLYELMISMKDTLPGANLFSYITFRAGGALMTSLLISFLLGPWLIEALRARQGKGQPIREDGPASHHQGRDPDHGRLTYFVGVDRGHFVMGRFAKYVFVDCCADDIGLWHYRICR